MKLHWFGKKTTNELSFNDEKSFRNGALKKINDLTKIRDRIIELEERDKNDGCDL